MEVANPLQQCPPISYLLLSPAIKEFIFASIKAFSTLPVPPFSSVHAKLAPDAKALIDKASPLN